MSFTDILPEIAQTYTVSRSDCSSSKAAQEYSLKIYILGLRLTQRCVPWAG